MERDNLEELIRQCPLVVRTNDGRDYFVEKPEFISVADYTTSILFTRDGKKLHAILANINITSIEPQGELAGN